jgi:hypothetical protein
MPSEVELSAMSDDVRLLLNIIYEMMKQPYTYDRGKLDVLFQMLELQTTPIVKIGTKK